MAATAHAATTTTSTTTTTTDLRLRWDKDSFEKTVLCTDNDGHLYLTADGHCCVYKVQRQQGRYTAATVLADCRAWLYVGGVLTATAATPCSRNRSAFASTPWTTAACW